MEDLTKKVSYIKGYADGLDISPKSDEGKLIIKLIDLLGEAAQRVEELDARVEELEDAFDELDESVFAIADDFYGDELDDEDGDCDEDDAIDGDYDDDLYEDGSDYFEIECPNCGEDVMIDFDMIDDENSIVCHEEIELEFDCEEDSEE